MKIKRADKFERMVNDKLTQYWPHSVRATSAATLLRQYHREVVALVKFEHNKGHDLCTQCADRILNKLKELAK